MKKGVFPDDGEFAKDMQFLASTYLSPESETQVNVSDELRESLTKMISGEQIATKSEVRLGPCYQFETATTSLYVFKYLHHITPNLSI